MKIYFDVFLLFVNIIYKYNYLEIFMKIVFINGKVVSLASNLGYIETNVVVQDDTIQYIGNNIPADANRIIDLKGNILAPGFINAHAHSAMTILRGLSDDVDFHEWLFNNIFPIEIISFNFFF